MKAQNNSLTLYKDFKLKHPQQVELSYDRQHMKLEVEGLSHLTQWLCKKIKMQILG